MQLFFDESQKSSGIGVDLLRGKDLQLLKEVKTSNRTGVELVYYKNLVGIVKK